MCNPPPACVVCDGPKRCAAALGRSPQSTQTARSRQYIRGGARTDGPERAMRGTVCRSLPTPRFACHPIFRCAHIYREGLRVSPGALLVAYESLGQISSMFDSPVLGAWLPEASSTRVVPLTSVAMICSGLWPPL